MIIVSQDKSQIANFDNIVQIYITSGEDEDIWEIRYESIDGLYETLGEYVTEKRAKEVLQEIIKSYRHYRTAETYGNTKVLEETAVFEMPKE